MVVAILAAIRLTSGLGCEFLNGGCLSLVFAAGE
jgi:hypothetical protein